MSVMASPKALKSIIRNVERSRKLNILTFATHERYEETLCKTGHNFYSLKILPGKEWDESYAKIPENYHIVESIPDYVDFDLILAHTSCNRLQICHDLLSSTRNEKVNKAHVPILRHSHVLPDIRYDKSLQLQRYHATISNVNSFISEFSRDEWGFNKDNAFVVEHGVDTDFWTPGNEKRDNVCLSVVNDWSNRDWCCGWNLWLNTIGLTGGKGTSEDPWKVDIPIRVFGKTPGLSVPAESIEHLRKIYQSSRIFYNTSLHSPVPTVVLEAMACGCAIVSTATCMIPDIIEHGVNGFISNDPNELRSYLKMLLNNEELATEVGQNAANTIKEKYNLTRFIDSWNSLFYNTVENFRG